jgi:spore coat polysaccharide biosynthesis protein SpsF
MSSTRLPSKVLMMVNNDTLLDIHVKRVSQSKYIDKHVVATSDSLSDNILYEHCQDNNIECYRGSEDDVLDRFYKVAQIFKPKILVRLTADCPLIDAELIDKAICLFISEGVDYVSNTMILSFPDGLDVEVFSIEALEKAWRFASLNSEREHVTPYIWKNSDYMGIQMFSSKNLLSKKDFSKYRLTVDEKEDFVLVENLIKRLGTKCSWLHYVNCIVENKIEINNKFSRNEGYNKSLKKD